MGSGATGRVLARPTLDNQGMWGPQAKGKQVSDVAVFFISWWRLERVGAVLGVRLARSFRLPSFFWCLFLSALVLVLFPNYVLQTVFYFTGS